jgi:hypothetical protein
MNVRDSLEQLKIINSKLEQINSVMICPVVPEQVRQQQLSLQYDYFMEFIGLYEDTMNYINKLEITDENKFEVMRMKKDIEKFWSVFNE